MIIRKSKCLVEAMSAASVLKPFWASWESSGKLAFMKHCKNAVVHADGDADCIPALQSALYGLASQVLTGTLKPESAASTAREMLLLRKDVASLLADTLSVVDVETTADEDEGVRLAIFQRSFMPFAVISARVNNGCSLISGGLRVVSGGWQAADGGW